MKTLEINDVVVAASIGYSNLAQCALGLIVDLPSHGGVIVRFNDDTGQWDYFYRIDEIVDNLGQV